MRASRMIVAGMLIFILAIPAYAIQEQTPEPGLRYKVVGVPEDDVLNVRAQPDASANVVGTFPADATDIAVAGTRMEVDGSVWWQVIGPDGLGWVNARYLSPVDADAPRGESFPLRCTGTEPFWTLTVREGKATFETPEASRSWRAGELTRAVGLLGRYAVRIEDGAEVGYLSAWRNYGFCSDGMSDIGFPFEGILAAPDGTVYGGCCMRAGE